MQNVKMSVKGNVLTITVDLSQDHGPSSSGKTIIVGSTSGFVGVPDTEGISVGLNVVRKGNKAAKSA